MRLSSFIYLTRQGLKNFLRNRLMTIASVGILSACLFITGAAVLLGMNVGAFVEYLSGQNEIVVYLQDALPVQETAAAQEETQQPTEETLADPETEAEQVEQTAEGEAVEAAEDQTQPEEQLLQPIDMQAAVAVIESIDNVQSYTYVSKDDALTEAIGWMGDYATLLEGYREDNPMPASFRITVKNLEQMDDTVRQLEQIQGVEYINSPSSMAGILVNLKTAVNWTALGLVTVLGLVCIIVIGNTIRLTVFARRREISIMKYVGATNAFIRYPFFVEGITIGLLAALVAFGLVSAGYTQLIKILCSDTEGKLIWLHNVFYNIIPYSALREKLLLFFLGGGALLGGLGTSGSIRKYLKV